MAERIGIIGVGVMGGAIARRLLERGYSVSLCSRSIDKLQPLAELGATLQSTPREIAANSDIVILSLNNAAIVDTVLFGPSGLAAAGRSKTLVIDMSSIDPVETRRLATQLQEQTGVAWVDAPLSGGAPAALAGKLTLMMGGAQADVLRAQTVLQDLAANMTRMGEVGAGQTTKLINQVLCACNFLSVAEATRLALDGGVDASLIPKALAGGRADSRILQEFMPKMAAGDLTPTGRIDNMLKDLQAVQRFAMSVGTPMPVTGLVTELHRMLIAAGLGGEDNAAYMKLFDFGRPQQTPDA